MGGVLRRIWPRDNVSPPGFAEPVRLDFFGDTLESIRAFDPETQRSSAQLRALDLVPMSEFQLTTETIKRFRQGYLSAFGANLRGDTLYEHVSEGRRHIGMEHWLPLFHAGLDPLDVYVPDATFVFDAQADGAAEERLAQIADYYDARKSAIDEGAGGVPYHPLPPEALYRSPTDWQPMARRKLLGTVDNDKARSLHFAQFLRKPVLLAHTRLF